MGKHTLFDICSIVFVVINVVPSTPAAFSRPNFNLSPTYQHQTTQSFKRLNNFDIEILRTVTESTSGNFMISPVSIKSVLAMILEGAKGETAEELITKLRLPHDQNEIRNLFNKYSSTFNSDSPGVTVESGNKVYVSNRYTINQNYKNILQNYYGASAESINFASTQNAANRINKWVSDITHGQISQLVDSGNFDAETVIILANALYFKGQWEVGFDKQLTGNKCFYVDGNCNTVPMMEREDDLKYALIEDTIQAQVVDLPYKGGKYAMTVILPKERNGLKTLVHDFSSLAFRDILSQMEKTEVQLSMPKFSIDYSEDMTNILKSMGVQSIFSKTANLSGMISDSGIPQVDAVAHKTRIEVDEDGSVASAATGAMVVALMGSTAARMTVDHPFLFIIRDIETEAILFAGRVEQPNVRKQSSPYDLFDRQDQKVNQPPVSKIQSSPNTDSRPSPTNSRVPRPQQNTGKEYSRDTLTSYYQQQPFHAHDIVEKPSVPLHDVSVLNYNQPSYNRAYQTSSSSAQNEQLYNNFQGSVGERTYNLAVPIRSASTTKSYDDRDSLSIVHIFSN